MALTKGYAGKVAVIDLTKPEATIVPTDRFFKHYGIEPRLWIGGDGFIAKIVRGFTPNANCYRVGGPEVPVERKV